MSIRYRFSGARVRQERKRRRLSLQELAAMIGVTPPFLGQIELGKRKPSLETFERLVQAFRAKPEALMVADGRDGDLPLERRIASLLQGQAPARQRALLDAMRFLLRRLPLESRDGAPARRRRAA